MRGDSTYLPRLSRNQAPAIGLLLRRGRFPNCNCGAPNLARWKDIRIVFCYWGKRMCHKRREIIHTSATAIWRASSVSSIVSSKVFLRPVMCRHLRKFLSLATRFCIAFLLPILYRWKRRRVAFLSPSGAKHCDAYFSPDSFICTTGPFILYNLRYFLIFYYGNPPFLRTPRKR